MTDLTAAPRPVPTTEDRMRDARTDRTFATYLDATERNQLDARAACAEAERDEALDARNVLRTQLDTARAELGAAQELLAVVDDLAEQLDRARARYATRPSEQQPGLGSAPPRAQEPPADAEWTVRFRDGGVMSPNFTEAGARHRAQEMGLEAVWRAVGPWQTAPAGPPTGEIPSWTRLDPAPIGSEPLRCRTRYADPTGLPHRCFLHRGHTSVHEWKTERP